MGGILINGPATANYDIDLGTYLVNDFFYKSATQVSEIVNNNLQNHQGPPPADNILINGTNKNANNGGTYGKVSMTAGKKYLLRIVNPSLDNNIRVSLDNHPFTIVTADLVPIHPYNTNWLLLGIGDSLILDTVGTCTNRSQVSATMLSSMPIKQLEIIGSALKPKLLVTAPITISAAVFSATLARSPRTLQALERLSRPIAMTRAHLYPGLLTTYPVIPLPAKSRP